MREYGFGSADSLMAQIEAKRLPLKIVRAAMLIRHLNVRETFIEPGLAGNILKRSISQ